MKKKLLFIVVLLASISIHHPNAQTKFNVRDLGLTPKVNKQMLQMHHVSNLNEVKECNASTAWTKLDDANAPENSAIKAPTANLKAYYLRPVGTLLTGLNAQGNILPPLIAGHSFKEWKFINQSTGYTGIEWSIGGNTELITKDNQGNASIIPMESTLLIAYTPQVTVSSGSATDSYYYGKKIVDDPQNNVTASLMAESVPITMTPADLWHGGFYSAFTDGYFGSGIINGDKVYAVMQKFEKPQAPLYMEEVAIFIYSESNIPIPAGGKFTCEVWNHTEDGKLNEKIASADAYKSDLINVDTRGDGSILYRLPFIFTEVDPDTQLETLMDLVVDESFSIVIGGLDAAGVDAGLHFSDSPDLRGGAFLMAGESTYYFYKEDAEGIKRNSYDLGIMIEGCYTAFHAVDFTRQLTAPIEGGPAIFSYQGRDYENVIISSSYDINHVDEPDVPEWVDNITYNNSDFATEGILEFYIHTKPLPDNLSGRAANVVLTSHGVKATIQVKQGDANWIPLALASPAKTEKVAVARQGDNFQLSYPVSSTSVSVYSLTGQRIAAYKLNASGNTVISATDWSKGVYLLKFHGSNQTVKVIK